MDAHEYQAKKILRNQGIKVPNGKITTRPQEAVDIVKTLGGSAWAIKAQVHAGGRGKAGGIRIAHSPEEAHKYTQEMLNSVLRTYQTGPQGKKIRKVLIEECCDIEKEFYLAVTIDRLSSQVVILASSQGGVEIERLAEESPEKIFKEYVDLETGLTSDQAGKLASRLNLGKKDTTSQMTKLIQALYATFIKYDCSLAEINPLVLTKKGELIALDAKLNFDDSALYRHPEIANLRDLEEEDPRESLAREHNLSYVKMEGNIGCLVNGAGLAMATMDIIKLYGGEPANFLDVGGGANTEQVTQAFKILLSDENVKVVLVNIFGGIMRCDVIAQGIVEATKEVKLKIPLVVRLEGTNVGEGKEILAASQLNIISANSMKDAAQKVVNLIK